MCNHISKGKNPLQKLLSEKLFRSEHLSFVTNRQVHHWKAIGLLNDYRKYAASGMKSSFNFYEVLWNRIITEMRSFTISNLQIKEVKRFLFTPEKDVIKEPFSFSNVIQEIILGDRIIFLTLKQDKLIKMLDKEEYAAGIDNGKINNHFAVRLDLLIWEMLTLLDLKSKAQEIIQHHKNMENK